MRNHSAQNIVIWGDKRDRQIADTLLRMLQKRFTIHHFRQSFAEAETVGSGDESINLIETHEMRELRLSPCILLVQNEAKLSVLHYLGEETSIIINASNTRGIDRLARLSKSIYTCGFSGKDYVTFSSREEENVVVSLQRSVPFADGAACEPFEIPCCAEEPLEDYTLLSCVLALILLRELDENKSKNIGKIYFS